MVKQTASLRKRIRHRVEYLLYHLLMMVMPLFPRQVLGWAASLLAWIAPFLVFGEARTAKTNLDLVYGETLSRKAKARILRQSFENVLLTAMLFFWLRRTDPENLWKFIEIPPESLNSTRKMLEQGKGGLVLLSHYGNWELMGVAAGFLNLPRLNVIVRRIKNPLLNDPVNRYRCGSGNRVIEHRNAMLKSLHALKRKEIVVLVFDQNVDPEDGGTFAPFLGLPAATTRAAAMLSLRTGAPIIPATCEPLPGVRYRLRFDEPLNYQPLGNFEEDVQRLTEQCNASLERVVLERPGPWLWMYKRWRIRPTIEQGRYPAYSKPARQLRQRPVEPS